MAQDSQQNLATKGAQPITAFVEPPPEFFLSDEPGQNLLEGDDAENVFFNLIETLPVISDEPPVETEKAKAEEKPKLTDEELASKVFATLATEESITSSNIANLITGRMDEAAKRPPKPAPAPKTPKGNSGGKEVTLTEGGEPRTRTTQPRRSRREVNDDRLYDGTQLHASHHGYMVHRDYAAHFFRWGFVSRLLKPGYRVLDIGCGQDLALPRVISAPNIFKNCQPSKVVCCDWNTVPRSFNPHWLELHDNFDFCKGWRDLIGSTLANGQFLDMPDRHFQVITCLEVIEHMDTQSGLELLQGIYWCLAPDGFAVISTPVFNGLAAANHIHEYTIPELQAAIESQGLEVVQRFGTFANINDLKKVMQPHERELMDQLSIYYGNDVLSCMFAPKYPDSSRNNLWIVRRKVEGAAPMILSTNDGEGDSAELEGEQPNE